VLSERSMRVEEGVFFEEGGRSKEEGEMFISEWVI
jgi:hypothetical protein